MSKEICRNNLQNMAKNKMGNGLGGTIVASRLFKSRRNTFTHHTVINFMAPEMGDPKSVPTIFITRYQYGEEMF